MAPPVWNPGQVLTASDVNNWFVALAGYKTADLGRTTTSQTADPDLSIAVQANATYMVDAALFFKTTTGGTSFQWTWTIPTGSGAGLYHAMYVGSGGGWVTEADQWTDAAHSAGMATAGTIYPASFRGLLVVGGTSGNFTLNWAASSATPTTTLTARSRLFLNRMG